MPRPGIVLPLLLIRAAPSPNTAASEQPTKAVREVPRLFVAEGWKDGWFRAAGSWEMGKQPMPTYFLSEQEAVDFNCYKDVGICVESTAVLTDLGGLMARTEIYEIQTWTTEQIQTKPAHPPCGSFQITIDRIGKKLFATMTNTAQRGSGCPESGTVDLIELRTTPGATGRDNTALQPTRRQKQRRAADACGFSS